MTKTRIKELERVKKQLQKTADMIEENFFDDTFEPAASKTHWWLYELMHRIDGVKHE